MEISYSVYPTGMFVASVLQKTQNVVEFKYQSKVFQQSLDLFDWFLSSRWQMKKKSTNLRRFFYSSHQQ